MIDALNFLWKLLLLGWLLWVFLLVGRGFGDDILKFVQPDFSRFGYLFIFEKLLNFLKN